MMIARVTNFLVAESSLHELFRIFLVLKFVVKLDVFNFTLESRLVAIQLLTESSHYSKHSVNTD